MAGSERLTLLWTCGQQGMADARHRRTSVQLHLAAFLKASARVPLWARHRRTALQLRLAAFLAKTYPSDRAAACLRRLIAATDLPALGSYGTIDRSTAMVSIDHTNFSEWPPLARTT